jgi:uncharacterized protein (TIGR02246 family)
MHDNSPQRQGFRSDEERAVRGLYETLLDNWNTRNADAFAGLFEEDANVVGFDGSQLNGRAEIASTLGQIFTQHQTAAFVGIVRDVRFLCADIALLRAVAGMVPPGQSDVNPAVNAVQTAIAIRHDDRWQLTLFQNTPAAFHGRPELSSQLTEDLQRAVRTRSSIRDSALSR